MNKPDSHNAATSKLPEVRPKKLRYGRWKVWLLPLFGVGAPLLWMTWPFLGWPAPITISPETTWITEPVGADGYVDYLAYLKQKRQEAGAHALSDDVWSQLMALEEPQVAVSSHPMAYRSPELAFNAQLKASMDSDQARKQYFDFLNNDFQRMQRVPWTTDEFPVIARTVAENEEWYSHVVDTFTKTNAIGYPATTGDPLTDNLTRILLPTIQVSREFTRRFLLRAAYRFGMGNTEAAMEDVAFASQIASRDGEFLISFLVRMSLDSQLSRTAVTGLLSAKNISGRVIDQVRQLPTESLMPDLINALDAERLMRLEQVNIIHKTGRFDACFAVSFAHVPQPEAWLAARRLYVNIDWNAVLRDENLFLDDLIEAMKEPKFAEANRRILELINPSGAAEASERIHSDDVLAAAPTTEDFIVVQRESHGFGSCLGAATAAGLRRHVVQIAARLAVWKLRHGEYPETLEELTSLPEFADTPSRILRDPFTGTQIRYKRQADGFTLRSPGANGVFDDPCSKPLTGEKPADWDGQTGDYLWQWPLVESQEDPR